MACNVYRRLHGVWPEAVRFAPGHFAAYASELDSTQIELLATVFDVRVSTTERSPRLGASAGSG